ncbi:MAG: hypothetical protein RL420_1320 [Pseudomonadota bacterium]
MTHNINLHALAQLVPVGSRVLDLGCGDGALLDHLQKHRSCSGYGVELADTNVQACVQRGKPACNVASMCCNLTSTKV